VLEVILATADDIPYNVQRLCHQLWAMQAGASERLTEKDVGEALTMIVGQDAPHFSAAWDRLSLHQRQVLQAIARSGGRNVFTKEFLATHRLWASSSVQRSLAQLLKDQIVQRVNGEYHFSDPFFREWVSIRLPLGEASGVGEVIGIWVR
jgi:hypothetical protein